MTFHFYFKMQRLTPVTLSMECKQVLQTLIFDKWVYTPNKEGNESFNAEFPEVFHSSAFMLKCSPVALQLRAPPPKVSARAPAHRSYHFRGVKLKSCIKKIHHNLYISKQANIRIKHADTEGASHKKFGTDARVQ